MVSGKLVLKPGVFNPNSIQANNEEDFKSFDSQLDKRIKETLDLPEGSMIFYARKQSGIVKIGVDKRSFEFDTSSNHAQFKSVGRKNRPIELNLEIKPNEEADHWYILFAILGVQTELCCL